MHRRTPIRVIALFLALMLFTQTGCIFSGYLPETVPAQSSAAPETTEAPEPTKSASPETEAPTEPGSQPESSAEAPTETPPESQEPVTQEAEQPPRIPEYYHYEKDGFLENVKKLEASQDSAEAMALYDVLYHDTIELMTLRTVAEINYDRDTTNTQASDEASYTYKTLIECGDAFFVACKKLTEGPHKDAFLAKVGQFAFDSYNEYRPMTDEEFELREREDKLEDDYDAVWNRLSDFVYVYDGEEWTFDRLNTADGSNLYYTKGADAYYQVFYGIEGVMFETLGPIYVEMVQIRDRIAKLNEYDNYVDYAYEETYGRDFKAADAQTFCDAVKKIAPEAYDEVEHGASSRITVNASFRPDELLKNLGVAAKELGPDIYSQWEYLTENELYDIGSESVRIDACFSTYLQSTETPFIFCKTSGRFRDFTSLTHEFGHFINFHNKKEDNPIVCPDRFDLSEIHSNGLELLMTNTYPTIFGSQADKAAKSEVADALQGILDGCLYDEFQRKVYSDPTMTAQQINDLFYQLCMEYGKDTEGQSFCYDWLFIPHNFSSPLYYLSYAVSGVSALEIWDTSQRDVSEGLALWKKVLSYSDNDKGYLEVAEACGLHPITDAEGVTAVLKDALLFIR